MNDPKLRIEDVNKNGEICPWVSANDTLDEVIALENTLAAVIEGLELPTLWSVLSDIKKQHQALTRGARIDVGFQNLAGTSKALQNKGVVSAIYQRFKNLFSSKHEKKPKPVKGLDGMYSFKGLSELI
jgi:ethanolamine ammonia-lyase large subunit